MPFRFLLLPVLFGLVFFVSASGQTPVPIAVNTPNDDTAPFQYSGRLYFTSIYQQHLDAGAVARIFSTNGQGTEQYDINPTDARSQASDLTFSSDAKRVYYTISLDGLSSIWYRERNFEGDWDAAKKLPPHVNLRGQSAKQPTVGFDQLLRKNLLYFASDRPGGQGGWDIWGSIIERDFVTGELTFGEPFLLPFNTPGDELTPFFHMASQTLFFSSNGLPGLGGLDVFSVKKDLADEWQQPANPGPSLNGPADDMHYTFHTSTRKGYFASNRANRLNYGPTDTISDFDIYEVNPSIQLLLSVFDIHDSTLLVGAVAEVFDEETKRSTVVREQPFDEGLAIQLLPERRYRIAVVAEGHAPQLLIVETGRQQLPITQRQALHLFRDEVPREVPGRIFPKEQPVQVKQPAVLTKGEEKLSPLPF